MFERGLLNKTEDYFLDFTRRGGEKIYFCRLIAFNKEVSEFLCRYLTEVKRSGLYIKGKLPNPDEMQLSYYEKVMGQDFQLNLDFIDESLKKWMPRLNMLQRRDISLALHDVLLQLSKSGKTDNMLKNTYIKFFCWFYYKFEGVLNQLGKERLPKVLYEGNVSAYELKALLILSKAGCDILLVLPLGSGDYDAMDPNSVFSQLIPAGTGAFPMGFSVSALSTTKLNVSQAVSASGANSASVRSASQYMPTASQSMPTASQSMPTASQSMPTASQSMPTASQSMPTASQSMPTASQSMPTASQSMPTASQSMPTASQSMPTASQSMPTASPASTASTASPASPVKLFRLPTLAKNAATNAWLTGDVFADSLKPQGSRGTDGMHFFYNMFVKLRGAEDRASYFNELFKWKLKLTAGGCNVLVLEDSITMPSPNAVQKILRKEIKSQSELLQNLISQISFPKNRELENCGKVAFWDVFSDSLQLPIQKLSNHAICVLCWLNEYLPKLFLDDFKTLPVLLFYGSVDSQNEAYFLRLLARMPIDVFVICPDLQKSDSLEDMFLFTKSFLNSMEAGKFPEEIDKVHFGTAAFRAEQDLNTIMYQDTGMYRNRQFKKAMPITLQTIYEEIKILWNQEAKYRPDFEILADKVMLPVIFSKISGVYGNKDTYWNDIADLIGEDTFLVSELPYIKTTSWNPMKQQAVDFVKNERLLVDKLKNHSSYPYSYIRDDMQDYMLDKLQELISRRLIKGTGTQGVEFEIFAVVMNLDKQIVRLIQKFDFTKTIPKLLVVHTTENICTLQDSILIAYLNLLGFDIALFVPTGYQTVERYFEQSHMVEHQAGEYMYDLKVPNFGSAKNQMAGFASRLFRRGR